MWVPPPAVAPEVSFRERVQRRAPRCPAGSGAGLKTGASAEGVGFEPTVPLPVHQLSGLANSATLAPLRVSGGTQNATPATGPVHTRALVLAPESRTSQSAWRWEGALDTFSSIQEADERESTDPRDCKPR